MTSLCGKERPRKLSQDITVYEEDHPGERLLRGFATADASQQGMRKRLPRETLFKSSALIIWAVTPQIQRRRPSIEEEHTPRWP